MYVWGPLEFGNASDRRPADDCPLLAYPTRMPEVPCTLPPTSFSMGLKHMVMLSEGTLYGLGNNTHNQLGSNIFEKTDRLEKLTAFHKVCDSTPVEVACGYKHTLVRTIAGDVWAVGDNTYSQLGHNKEKFWHRVAFTEPAERIAAGPDRSYIVSAGRLFSWGSPQSGALGHGTTGAVEMIRGGNQEYKMVPKPKQVDFLLRQRVSVVDVSVGKEHLLIRTEEDVYTCGQGAYGKLGFGDIADQLLPRRVVFPERSYQEKLIQVAAGADHSVVLKQSQEFGSVIYHWGRVENTGDGNLWPMLMTEAGRDVTSIWAGKYFTMAVSSDGSLQVWGKAANLPGLGLDTNVRDKKWPTIMGCLKGKHILSTQSCGSIMVAFADDSKAAPDQPLDVIPSMDYRNPTYPYDVASEAFFKRVLGDEEGAAYFAKLPAPEAKVDRSIKYTPRGTAVLRCGSKVRVWVEDVYALGTVIECDLAGPNDTILSNHFRIQWLRGDWRPEVLELYDEDETLDEDNANRWQHLWFLELPEGCEDHTEERQKRWKPREIPTPAVGSGKPKHTPKKVHAA